MNFKTIFLLLLAFASNTYKAMELSANALKRQVSDEKMLEKKQKQFEFEAAQVVYTPTNKDKHNYLITAYFHEREIGYISFVIKKGSYNNIVQLFVKHKLRKKGVASQLLKRALETMKEKNPSENVFWDVSHFYDEDSDDDLSIPEPTNADLRVYYARMLDKIKLSISGSYEMDTPNRAGEFSICYSFKPAAEQTEETSSDEQLDHSPSH